MKRTASLALIGALVVAAVFATPVSGGIPVVVDHSAVTAMDTPTVIDRTGDTYDATGAIATVTEAPLHGGAAFDGDVLTYTPDEGYVGADEFRYMIVDSDDGESGVSTVSVTVEESSTPDAVNADPVAVSDSASVPEDGTVLIGVLGNDSDPDGDTLAVGSVSTPAHGNVSIVGVQIRYTPDSGYNGPDAFTYRANDGNGGTSNAATVSVTVTPNGNPVANPDSASVSEDGSTDINVVGNDTDPDGDPVTLYSVSTATHGSTSTLAGKVHYVPTPNYSGPDSFTYRADDGHGGLSSSATVTVTVDPTNDPPVATSETATVAEDGSVDIDVLGNDNDIDADGLSITNLSDPPHGTAGVSSGKVHYEPDPNYHGSDSFTYTAADASTTSNIATVSITVTSVNDAPEADDDEFTVPEDPVAAVALLVLAGDQDVDGDTLDITAKTNGSHGTVAITGGGTGLTYRPNHDYSGDDTFTYTVSDGHLSDTATVTVHVGGANDPPVAAPDALHVAEGSKAVALAILGNDFDPDGNPLIIFSSTAALHGAVTITGNGTGLTYDPSGNYHGSDKFKYTVTDGNGGFSTATVLITVDPDTTDPVVVAPVERFLGQTVGSSTTKVRLTWSATDAGSGVASYKLQVSTDGGSYKTVKLAKATSTSVDRSLTTGHSYRFRVRATDKEGNVSSFSYGPTVTPKRYSQESSLMVYVGSWKTKTTSKALGGSSRYATSPSRSATFRFTGYDVGWIATRYTSSGKAQILVDGVLVTTVDLDTSSTAYRKLVFQRHFPTLGAHTLQIRPVGDGRVDIDGFVVLR